MTLEESLRGTKAPQNIIDSLILLDIEHVGFSGQILQGQLLIDKNLSSEVKSIFEELKNKSFPIEKMTPVVVYDWDDEKSMSNNNSSAFNYRFISGTETLSRHSFGQAIDLNPRQNPFVSKKGEILPAGAIYNKNTPGTICDNGIVFDIFFKYGWEWGGDWGKTRGYFDYHHFQKKDLRYLIF